MHMLRMELRMVDAYVSHVDAYVTHGRRICAVAYVRWVKHSPNLQKLHDFMRTTVTLARSAYVYTYAHVYAYVCVCERLYVSVRTTVKLAWSARIKACAESYMRLLGSRE